MKIFFENRTIKIVAETKEEEQDIISAIRGYDKSCNGSEIGLIEFSTKFRCVNVQIAAIESSTIHFPFRVKNEINQT